jgi:hypothetical protein
MLWVENRLLVWEVSSMDTNKNLEWLKNIRSLARDDLHLANVMLDTMPVGASLTEPDILIPPSIKPDTRPNVDEIELLLTGKGKIPAIRDFRARTGMGLRESKEIIEAWCAKVGLSVQTVQGIPLSPILHPAL